MNGRVKKVDQDLKYVSNVEEVRRESALHHAKT